jgi:hypothetical protein
LIFFAASFTLICVWAIVASAFLLAIAQDTAEGADQIEAWPEAAFVDWAFEFFFIVNSLIVGVLPGVVALQVLTPLEWPLRVAAVPCGLFFLFPIVLLSMLESGSVFVPFSSSVAGSLLSKWWAWAVFYLESAALLAVLLGVAGVLFRFLGPWSVFLIAIAWVWGLMVYFRLLGRLAWYCGPGREARDEEPEDRSRDRAPKVPPMTVPPPMDAPRPAPEGETIPLAEPTEPEVPSHPPEPGRREPAPEPPVPEPPAEPPAPGPPTAKRPRSILDDDFDAS